MQSAFFFIPFFGSWGKGLFMAYVRNKKKILKFWSKKKRPYTSASQPGIRLIKTVFLFSVKS